MSNPWFRFYSEFSHDPKVQMMSESMQRRYIMIMCLRCSNELVTLHETEIAFHLRITDDELAETKALFISKGFIDDQWNLLNWDKRQFKSDSSAERVTRHRENKKRNCNDDVTLQKRPSNALDTDTDTDTDTDKNKIKSKSATATRLPADWILSDVDRHFCATERPDLQVDAVADGFRDYWLSAAGAKGRKADWSATWRNWVRNQHSPPARASPAYKNIHDQRAETYAILTGKTKNERPNTDERVITGEAVRIA